MLTGLHPAGPDRPRAPWTDSPQHAGQPATRPPCCLPSAALGGCQRTQSGLGRALEALRVQCLAGGGGAARLFGLGEICPDVYCTSMGGPASLPSGRLLHSRRCCFDGIPGTEAKMPSGRAWLHSPHKSVQGWACPPLNIESRPPWPSSSSGAPGLHPPSDQGARSCVSSREAGADLPLLLCPPHSEICGPLGP